MQSLYGVTHELGAESRTERGRCSVEHREERAASRTEVLMLIRSKEGERPPLRVCVERVSLEPLERGFVVGA